METQILKENLAIAVTLVGRFAAQKAQLPVLSQIVIEARDKEIYMMATDLDKGIRLRVAGKVVSEGRVAVPARVLAELVQSMPLGVVELRVEDQYLKLQAGTMKAELQTMNAEDFPEMGSQQKDREEVGVFATSDFADVYERVRYAVSKDESRPVLTGILWEVSKGKVAATDGYRLSVIRGRLKSKSWKEGEALLVSGVFWGDAVKVLEDVGVERVGIFREEQQLVLEAGDVWLTGRLVEGDYPSYQAIIPKEFAVEVILQRKELLGAVRAAAIFARDSANIVKLHIGGRELVVSANAPQVGKNEVRVELLVEVEGEHSIAFNSKYLVDYLSSVAEEEVGFAMGDALQPGMFKSEEGVVRHVIMPVRVKG